MKREDVRYIFSELGEKHKAIKTSYTGILEEFNTDSETKYPVMITNSITDVPIVQKPNFTDQYNVVFWVLDQLPTDRTTDDIEEALDRTSRIIKQILVRLDTFYNDTTLTINNLSVKTGFLLDVLSMNQFYDDTLQNHTGWQVILTLTQRTDRDVCCLDDVFDA